MIPYLAIFWVPYSSSRGLNLWSKINPFDLSALGVLDVLNPDGDPLGQDLALDPLVDHDPDGVLGHVEHAASLAVVSLDKNERGGVWLIGFKIKLFPWFSWFHIFPQASELSSNYGSRLSLYIYILTFLKKNWFNPSGALTIFGLLQVGTISGDCNLSISLNTFLLSAL